MINNSYRSRSFVLAHHHSHNRWMFISVIFLGGIILSLLLAFVAFGSDFGDLQEQSSSLKLVIIVSKIIYSHLIIIVLIFLSPGTSVSDSLRLPVL